MPSTVPPRDWTEIHWPDVARIDAARWIAVLPLAATEQHGPHLPVGVDTILTEGVCRVAAEQWVTRPSRPQRTFGVG